MSISSNRRSYFSRCSGGLSAREVLDRCGDNMKTYETVSYYIVFLEDWSSHLGVLVIVVFDEGCVGHAGLLLHEDGGFDDLAEAGRVGIPSFENHDGQSSSALDSIWLSNRIPYV